MESIFHLRHHPKSGFLQYRRVVPPKLRAIVGKGTITATLGSKVLDHAALIRWVEIDRDAQRRLDDARRKLAGQSGDDDGASSKPIFIDIRKCVIAFSAWKDQEIGRQSVRLYGLAGGEGGDDPLTAFKSEIAGVRNGLAAMTGTNVAPDFDQRLVQALGTVGISVPGDHLIMNALRPLFRDAWIEVIKVVQGLVEAVGGAAPTPDDPVEQVRPTSRQHQAATPATSEGPKLSELAEGYLRYCDAEEDYASDLRMYVRRLQESLGGDRHVAGIAKRDMIKFLDEISRLPARLSPVERRASLQEVILKADTDRQRGIGRTLLSRKTTEKWLQCLGAMFRFGQQHELCDGNPAGGIKPIRKKNADPPRQHFEPDEIQMIFGSPLYTGHDGGAYRCKPGRTTTRDAKYWLPLMALFTGCRRDEMVQARVADVKEQDGIHFLHITTITEDGGRQKRVKTASSRRMIPLHQTLVDAGFLRHVDGLRHRGQMYLFPEIDQTVKEPAGSFGKWFDRFCERLAEVRGVPAKTGIDSPTRTFHSFRHTFKRACRDAEITKDIHDELTGHASGADVGSGYGRTGDGRFSLSILNGAIQKIRFPVNIR